jgi:Flp pilus assembly protein protease CpaA
MENFLYILKSLIINNKIILLSLFSLVVFLHFMTSKALAWEIHNFSNETRVFDEFRDNAKTPYTKTVRPGGMASFSNSDRIVVIDRKTGQPIHNPSNKMMEVTKQGNIKLR